MAIVRLLPNKTIVDAPNDKITAFGLVDGVEYSVTVWRSHLTQQTGTASQRKEKIRQFLAQQLKLEADRAKPIDPTNFDIDGPDITV